MFNLEEFNIKLDTEILGRNFLYIDECKSTNEFLLNTNDFRTHGTVLLAEFQTHGKGRNNRTWESNKGQNLTFSVLLNQNIKPKLINIINLGSSLAVARTIENLYQLKVNLKWPNDILVKNKKIAGILIESSSKGKKIEKIVFGIGINVNQITFPSKFIFPPTSIKKEFKESVSRERLLSMTLNELENIFNLINQSPQKILDDWKAKCKMLGEKVKIINGENEKYGIFEDLDDNGFLILKEKGKTEMIHFGDVSLRQ